MISASIDPDDLKEFQHEARMMTQLHHPCVITFYGVCEKTMMNEKTGDPEQRMYMVTELAPGGSLEDHILKAILLKKLIRTGKVGRKTKMPFDGLQMVKWALQIAAGMSFVFLYCLIKHFFVLTFFYLFFSFTQAWHISTVVVLSIEI